MTPEKYKQLKPLFEQALDTPPAQRADFILTIRMADEELGRELESLIESHSGESGDATKSIDTPLVRFNHLFPPETPSFVPQEMLLDRFRIMRFIGKGGMGEVYEAEDMHLGRIAIKTIRTDLAGRPEILARFRQEVQLARRVANPAVCRIHELFPLPAGDRRGAAAFLTMEYLEGVTLAERLHHDGALPVPEAESIALQLCAAVQAIHDAGVLHRDIKSRNIMLVPKNGATQVVVMDLGLAGEAAKGSDSDTGLTMAGAVMGTRAYMAPELLAGARATPASDVFALGVVLYEMVTGKLPPEVVKTKPAPPASSLRKDLPKHWASVIGSCLQYEREKRYQSANEVAEALQNKGLRGQMSARWFVGIPLNRALSRAGLIAASAAALLVLVSGFLWYRAQVYSRPSPDAQHWYDEGLAAIRDGTFYKATQALTRAVSLDKNFVLAHARLADAWSELDFTGKAKDEMLRASSLETNQHLPAIDRQYLDAVRATLTWDYAPALQDYQNILRTLPAKDKAYGYVDLGRVEEKAGDLAEALKAYTEAARLAPEYPASFVHLGILQSRQGKQDEGDAAFSRAESLYRAASNPEGLAEVDWQRGYAASLKGDTGHARQFLELSLHAARDIPSVQLEIRALTRMSTVEYQADNTDKSIELANQSIQLARENGLDYWAIDGLIRLGNAWLTRNDYAKAELPLQEGLRLAQESQRPRLEANARLTLASIRNLEDKPDEAVALAQGALNYYEKAGFAAESVSSLILIVRSERDKADFNTALPRAREALDLVKKAKNPALTMQVEELVGSVLLQMENYPGALVHFQSALTVARAIGEYVEYESLHCADALWRLGRYSEAEEMIRSLPPEIAARPRIATQINEIKAHMLLSQRQYGGALGLTHSMLATKGLSAEAMIDMQIVAGMAAAQSGSSREAESFCKTALDAATRERDPEFTAQANWCQAEAWQTARSPREALPFAESAHNQFLASGQVESQWRILLRLAEIAKSSGDSTTTAEFSSKALDMLSQAEHNWGTAAFETYSRRPDIIAERQELSRFSGR